jgi:hypothetical protein
LEVQKNHACPNDYILYRSDEYENLDACPVCNAKRYKIRQNDIGDVGKKIPAKVMWYFPIIRSLRHLFRNKTHAKLMQWQKEESKQD